MHEHICMNILFKKNRLVRNLGIFGLGLAFSDWANFMMMGMCCVGLMGSNKSFGLGLSDLDMAWLGMWCEGINC
jgi:hypothetical protein